MPCKRRQVRTIGSVKIASRAPSRRTSPKTEPWVIALQCKVIKITLIFHRALLRRAIRISPLELLKIIRRVVPHEQLPAWWWITLRLRSKSTVSLRTAFRICTWSGIRIRGPASSSSQIRTIAHNLTTRTPVPTPKAKAVMPMANDGWTTWSTSRTQRRGTRATSADNLWSTLGKKRTLKTLKSNMWSSQSKTRASREVLSSQSITTLKCRRPYKQRKMTIKRSKCFLLRMLKAAARHNKYWYISRSRRWDLYRKIKSPREFLLLTRCVVALLEWTQERNLCTNLRKLMSSPCSRWIIKSYSKQVSTRLISSSSRWVSWLSSLASLAYKVNNLWHSSQCKQHPLRSTKSCHLRFKCTNKDVSSASCKVQRTMALNANP